jgi:hypothetical protein
LQNRLHGLVSFRSIMILVPTRDGLVSFPGKYELPIRCPYAKQGDSILKPYRVPYEKFGGTRPVSI